MFRLLLFALLALAACRPDAPPETPPSIVRILNFWQAAAGTLAGAPQTWRFAGRSGDVVRLRALGQNVTLALLAEDGTPLGQGGQIETALPADGLYTVLVSGSGPYELGLSYADRPNPADSTPSPLPEVVGVPTPTPPYYAALGDLIGALASGETRTGAFAGAGERHVYTFTGRAGQYAAITMRRISGSTDPVLTLYGPDGGALAIDDNSGGERAAFLRNIRLPADGTYSIQAGGDDFIGGYELSLLTGASAFPVTPTLIVRPTPTPIFDILTPTFAAPADGRLSDHIPAFGVLTRPGDVARYAVEAAAGSVISLGVRAAAGSELIPRLELYNPLGEQVATASGATPGSEGEALIPALDTAEAGVYLAYITAENGTTGEFIVAYGQGSTREDVRRGRIEPDQPVDAGLSLRAARDLWSLFLRAGDEISAAARPSGAGVELSLELVAPDGALVAQGSRAAGDEDTTIPSARAPVTGLYYLRVAAFGARADYSLVWRAINLSPTPTPPPGLVPVLLVDDFAPRDVYLFYPFQGQAGEQVEVRVVAQPGGALDPVAALVAPDGALLLEVDDVEGSLNPYFIVTLPADGTYRVRVNGYLSVGVFELAVSRLAR
ncbi:MAG: PPC domain-containing protein [Chloroflexi bacterium]|nr:PPC domain-containing protein [Chloroflexota bacterium]